MHLDGIVLGGDVNRDALACQCTAEHVRGIAFCAIEGRDLARQGQQQEGFSDTARCGHQRGLRLRKHAFDQPAPGLGVAGEAIQRAPL